MLPQLNQKGKYPVTDPSVRSFQGWEFNIKTSLQKAIKQVHSPAFAQVVLIDPTTMPPTPISMTQPGHTTLGVTSGLLHTALKSHTTPCGTIVGLKQRKYRVCVAALTTPKPLKPSESNAVLEIFRPLK